MPGGNGNSSFDPSGESEDEDFKPPREKKAKTVKIPRIRNQLLAQSVTTSAAQIKLTGTDNESTEIVTSKYFQSQDVKLHQQSPNVKLLQQPQDVKPHQQFQDVKSHEQPQDVKSQHMDMEAAYKSKNYAYVLELLLKDKMYPENFKFIEIHGTEDGKDLKKFVTKINNLHKFILKDDVEEIKKILPIGSMKLYLSTNNNSALFMAYIKKRPNVCSYLNEIGAEFKDEDEEFKAMDFDFETEAKLTSVIVSNSSCVKNMNVFNLLGKTRKRPEGDEKLDEIITNYYKTLDKIPEISTIFKVLGTVFNLGILFDFSRVNVDHMCPSAKKSFGSTEVPKRNLYIAAKESKEKNRGQAQIMGTVAHESSHLAFYAVFNNSCNPYRKGSADEEVFERIYWGVYRKLNKIADKYSWVGEYSNHPWRILQNVFKNYAKKPAEYPSEIIVAISQILAENPGNRDWLRINFPEYFEFYQKTLAICEDRVKNSGEIHLSKTVENFNKHEIEQLKGLQLSFKNIDKNYFLDTTKNIMIVEGENVTLTLLRTLQKLYGKDYDAHSDKYLIIPFHKIVEGDQSVTDCLQSMLVKTIIIKLDTSNVPDDYINILLVAAVVNYSENRTSYLKFVIIVPKNEKRVVQSLKKSCKPMKIVQEVDEEFSLNDLEDRSVNKILYKRITFQGKETVLLKDLIQKDENIFKLLNFKSTLMLCSEENIKLGGKLSGTSGLEGSYTDVIEKMNVSEFCKKVKSPEFFYIFIITGLQGNKKYENFMSILRDLNKREHINENFCGEYQETVFKDKKILFRECELTDVSFKNFCNLNPEKKIYLINLIYRPHDARPTPELILKRYYNPSFYNRRRFKRKIVAKPSDLLKNSEQFVFSKSEDKNVITGDNFHYFSKEGEARVKFEEFARERKTVHLFSFEKGKKSDEIVWKNSTGSVNTLPVVNSRNCLDEKAFAIEIKDRKVVLIADDPGTGKSTSLTKLYEQKYHVNETICGKNWLIRINLRDHLNSIRTIDSVNFDTKKLIEFLTEIDESLKTDLNRNFLHLAITFKNFQKPLLIVLDGFDEVPNRNDRERVTFLSKYLANHTECKIWVTTRLNFKRELETELSTLAFEFQAINGHSKISFMKQYFYNRLDLIVDKPDSKKLKNYADCLKDHLKNIFSKDSEKFIGTPLQLFLILENCVDSYKRYVSGENEKPDFSDLGDDLLQVYDKFLCMKYEVYFRKISLNEASKLMNKDFYNHFFKNLAESIIFKNDFREFLEKHEELMLGTGIIKSLGNDVEFIHLTFREYFLSEVVVDYLLNRNHRKLNINVIEILIKDIFLQPDFQMLRNFIGLHLKNANWDEMPDLKEIGVVMGLLWGKNPTVRDNKGTVLHVALEEKNETLFSFIITCCKKTFSDDQFFNLLIATNSRFHTIFHIVACLKSKVLCELLLSEVNGLNLWLEHGRDLLNYKVGGKDSPLGLAKRKRNYEVGHVIEAELKKLTPEGNSISQ